MKTFLSCLLCTLLLFYACQDMGTNPGERHPFAIYLLSDTSITAVRASASPLEELQLAQKPFITEKDIKAYHWSDHSILFQPNTDTALFLMSFWPYRSWGLPFVVVAQGERIYLGAFWWGYSNYDPAFPYIELMTPSAYRISWDKLSSAPDPRSDARIHDALQSSGVLVQ